MKIPVPQRTLLSASPLAGKVSLVTGSTSGIGLGQADDIARVKAGLADTFGVDVSYSPADMTRPDAIQAMIEAAIASHGRLDIVVNNAGIQHVAPLQDFPPEKWEAILAINLSSAFHTTRLALPGMIRNKWGRIVNIASAHGLVASPFKSPTWPPSTA